MMKRNRKKKIFIILTIIIVPILGLKVSFEVENVFHEKRNEIDKTYTEQFRITTLLWYLYRMVLYK